jgi:hypothetical protein
MPDSAFVIRYDDFSGFVVEKRFPQSLSLTEETLNLIHFEHQKAKMGELIFFKIGDMLIASLAEKEHPNWVVCFVLDHEEEYEFRKNMLAGMGRLILELIEEAPETVVLEDIIEKRSTLDIKNEEQKTAQIFLTPSSALILEKMQTVGVERAAKLAIWLKEQVQSDNVDIREAIAPLMESGVVAVERLGKTSENVYLLKDVFGYRAPPFESLQKTENDVPELLQKYREQVSGFFSPPPPNRGYNPTIPVDDPNSPIMEDRRVISGVLSNSLCYKVLQCLRDEPLSVKDISRLTDLPEAVVETALWKLERDNVAIQLSKDAVWGIITNPKIESFLPEYVLPIISKKLTNKDISPETAKRYLELLIQTWSEQSD